MKNPRDTVAKVKTINCHANSRRGAPPVRFAPFGGGGLRGAWGKERSRFVFSGKIQFSWPIAIGRNRSGRLIKVSKVTSMAIFEDFFIILFLYGGCVFEGWVVFRRRGRLFVFIGFRLWC